MALDDRAKVRLLAVGDSASAILANDDVDFFLSENGGDVYLAAADMCLAIAGSAALVAKAQSSGQFSSAKQSIPAELRANAEALRKKSESIPYSGIAEQWTYPWDNPVLDDTEESE
jgi:hypothetical protein